MPDALWNGAIAEARALGDGWLGPEHVLLALLATPSVASETLEELGLSHAAVAERLRDRPGREEARPGGLRPNPKLYGATGRAEGFAASDGAESPRPEHWLLALVWDDRGTAVQVLHSAGITQAAVLDGLGRRGVRVPDIDPPMHRPWRGREEITVSAAEVQPLINVLIREHPPGSEWRWGFNWTRDEPRRGIFIAEEGVDLDAALRQISR